MKVQPSVEPSLVSNSLKKHVETGDHAFGKESLDTRRW